MFDSLQPFLGHLRKCGTGFHFYIKTFLKLINSPYLAIEPPKFWYANASIELIFGNVCVRNIYLNYQVSVDRKVFSDRVRSLKTLRSTEGKDWIDMAAALERNDYSNTLSTGFKIAGFEKGENLTKAALALRQGDPINAFYEGLSLIDGVDELVDAFKYLKDGEAKKAVPLMIKAAPKLAVLST
jgi:hypothetical protein